MDDYELQQKQITTALAKYEKNQDKQLYRKIKHELDMYLLFLDENFADQEKYDWYYAQVKLLNELRQKKQLICDYTAQKQEGSSAPPGEKAKQDVTQKMKMELTEALDRLETGVEKAIQISNFIRVELDKQIEQLDKVYEQNKNFEARMKRAKEGLLVILRQAMTNKITRFFAMLLVVAIIGVIIVLILRSSGTIA